MASTKHKPRRNARKPAKSARKYRNAGPPRPVAPRAARPQLPQTPLARLASSTVSAVVTSFGGALLTRSGLPPRAIAAGLAAVGGYFAWKGQSGLAQSIGLGAATSGSSQALLMTFKPQGSAPQIAVIAPQPQPQPQPQRKNAELGALPPGALDAAFERARAALAVDAYPQEHGEDQH